IDHGADGDSDAAETHYVRAQSEQVHAKISDQHTYRQGNDGHKRAAYVNKKEHADERYDNAFFGQSSLERADRAIDQIRAIVDPRDSDTLRRADQNIRKPVLDILDDGERIFAEPL